MQNLPHTKLNDGQATHALDEPCEAGITTQVRLAGGGVPAAVQCAQAAECCQGVGQHAGRT